MDALSSALQSPGFSNIAKLLSLGSAGYGLYNNYENQQYQNLLRSYAQNPAKMNAYAEQFTKPLTAGLQAGVANQAQAYLANRGLSESPQISEEVESQAIAPYIQQDQQQGYQDALEALGLGGGAQPQAPGSSVSQLAQILGAGSGQNPYFVLQQAQQPTGLQTTDPGGSGAIPLQDLQSWWATT